MYIRASNELNKMAIISYKMFKSKQINNFSCPQKLIFRSTVNRNGFHTSELQAFLATLIEVDQKLRFENRNKRKNAGTFKSHVY